MEIRKFRKAYDLELIPASHAGIMPGDLVWDPVLGPPRFTRKGMPSSVFTAFLDAGLINEEQWKAFQKDMRQAAIQEAQLASRTVEVDAEVVGELKHPELGKIKGEFLAENIRKFTFGNLMVREMSNLIRVRIDHYLEEMKASHWDLYDGSIRRVFMITELYYGSIKMVVEKRFSAELEAMLKQTGLQASARTEDQHAVEYAFSHDQVPFAMRIERIRTFNG
jgi:hypothetical protein